MEVLRLARWLALALAGCYTVPGERCALKCTTECPSSMTCGADGFCHAANDDASCVAPTDAGDAGTSCPGNFLADASASAWNGYGGTPTAIAGRTTPGVQICSDGTNTSITTNVLDSTSIEADASFALQAWVRTSSNPDAGLVAVARFQEYDGGPNPIGNSSSPDTPLADAWMPIATSYTTTIGGKHMSAVFVLKNEFAGACLQVSDVCVQRKP